MATRRGFESRRDRQGRRLDGVHQVVLFYVFAIDLRVIPLASSRNTPLFLYSEHLSSTLLYTRCNGPYALAIYIMVRISIQRPPTHRGKILAESFLDPM